MADLRIVSMSTDENVGRPEVRVSEGWLRGSSAGNVRSFLSVPYAAPPVRSLRFAEPEPPIPWKGMRAAHEKGSTAPQKVRDFPGLDIAPLVGNGWVEGDDYLTLNIWRPDSETRGLPVMVFIHGGGFVLGSKDAAVSDGSAFARDGVVCVAINYRLGIEGFLPIPDVPTNLGLRDQIAALRWVRSNISEFGGDPANITVFGESAGAMSIATLITSPRARGLFRRAILQSGHGGMTRDISVARRLVKKLAKILDVTPDAAGFRSVTPRAAVEAVATVSQPGTRLDLRDAEGREPAFGISRFIPVHGDDVLPQKPLDALAAGAGMDIDLLIGSNAEEMNLYLVPSGARDKVGCFLAVLALRKSQPQAHKVLKAYGLGGKGTSPGEALISAMTDLVFRWPARRFAEMHQGRTHVYEFEWRSPAFGGSLGACHGLELPFVFDTLTSTTGTDGLVGTHPPKELAERIHGIWLAFATDGTLPWKLFDKSTRHVYRLQAGKADYEPPMPAAAFLP